MRSARFALFCSQAPLISLYYPLLSNSSEAFDSEPSSAAHQDDLVDQNFRQEDEVHQ